MARTDGQRAGPAARDAGLWLASLFVLATAAGATAAPGTSLVSIDHTGGPSNGDSYLPAISADARFIVFESAASNLVIDDTNSVNDIFLRDLETGTTERISISSSGAQSNGASFAPAVSADGRFIAFLSSANNLVDGDANDRIDAFVRDRIDQTTERISVRSDGGEANGHSYAAAISANGLIVVFLSSATNLVDDDENGFWDIFLHDRWSQETVRINLNEDGDEGDGHANAPEISPNGRFVAFESAATNLVGDDHNGVKDVFLLDRQTGEVQRIDVTSDGEEVQGGARGPVVCADGSCVAFFSSSSELVPDDDNGEQDVFLRDLAAGSTTLVSVSSAGVQADGASYAPAVSGDGRFIAFISEAENLVGDDDNGEPDVFLRDRIAGTTIRISTSDNGEPADDASATPDVDPTGRRIVFGSAATNLVEDDPNDRRDIFLRRLDPLADLNGDGSVNVLDLLVLLGAWGPCANCPEDLNGDGTVSVLDLLLLLDQWG